MVDNSQHHAGYRDYINIIRRKNDPIVTGIGNGQTSVNFSSSCLTAYNTGWQCVPLNKNTSPSVSSRGAQSVRSESEVPVEDASTLTSLKINRSKTSEM